MTRIYAYVPVHADARPTVRYADSPARWPVRAAVRVFHGPTEIGIAVHVTSRRAGNDRSPGGWLAVDVDGRIAPTIYPTQFATAVALSRHDVSVPSSRWVFTWPHGRPTTTIVGV